MDLSQYCYISAFWHELGVWYEDATGGKAIRELGYEPVEEDVSDDSTDQ